MKFAAARAFGMLPESAGQRGGRRAPTRFCSRPRLSPSSAARPAARCAHLGCCLKVIAPCGWRPHCATSCRALDAALVGLRAAGCLSEIACSNVRKQNSAPQWHERAGEGGGHQPPLRRQLGLRPATLAWAVRCKLQRLNLTKPGLTRLEELSNQGFNHKPAT